MLVMFKSGSQVCLETLKELAVADPRVVAHTNGFRVLLAAAIDPANQVGRARYLPRLEWDVESCRLILHAEVNMFQMKSTHHRHHGLLCVCPTYDTTGCFNLQDLAEPLVTTLMSIIEDPATRRYVRPHLELHQLLTGFTDLDAPPGPERAQRWKVHPVGLGSIFLQHVHYCSTLLSYPHNALH